MAVKFNVLNQENQPLESPQKFPKSALGQRVSAQTLRNNQWLNKELFKQVS
jgi:hypothetical protein